MATKQYKWRKSIGGYSYIHTETGSNIYGDGTAQKPYQSLEYAISKGKTNFIVYGVITGNFPNASHGGSYNIVGDYLGAAIYDGQGIYSICGWRHQDMIIRNVIAGNEDTSLHFTSGSPSPLLAGVGLAAYTSNVGNAALVYGLAGPSNIVEDCGLYFGCAGGDYRVHHVVFARPKANATYKVAFGNYSGDISNSQRYCTFYDCPIERRTVAIYPFFHEYCIYSKFAIIVGENSNLFTRCLFLADTPWYYKDKSLNQYVRILIGDKTSSSIVYTLNTDGIEPTLTINGVGDIDEAIDALVIYANADVTLANRLKFHKCVFSDMTAEQVFNNADKGDYSLKITGAGMVATPVGDWNGFPFLVEGSGVIDERHYYGAIPPSLNVPIIKREDNDGKGSQGIAGCWDEETASGLITISEDNNIVLDEDKLAAGYVEGNILSKVIYNGSGRDIAGVFARYTPHFLTHGIAAWMPEVLDTSVEYHAGDVLVKGRYLLHGKIAYTNAGGEIIEIDSSANGGDKTIVLVTADNTTFSELRATSEPQSVMIYIDDPNTPNSIYIRSRNEPIANVASGSIEDGYVYQNNGAETITYLGRTIGRGESFIGAGDRTFTASAGYTVSLIFNNTEPWIPAQMFGEYFTNRDGSGQLVLDDAGVPVSSGNYMAYQSPYNTAAEKLKRKMLTDKYIQLQLYVQSVMDNVNE